MSQPTIHILDVIIQKDDGSGDVFTHHRLQFNGRLAGPLVSEYEAQVIRQWLLAAWRDLNLRLPRV